MMNVPLLDLKAQYKTIKNEVDSAVAEVFESQYFILGPTVKACEEAIAKYCNCAHAIGVTSGTDALLISLMCEDVGPGDEVITTPYTFFATAGSIARTGATPVFVDIDPVTYNINPDLDSSGNPLFYIKEIVFDLNSDNGLTQQCRYGPSLTEFTTQIRRQGFIQGVEFFQVLYGQDSDLDGSINAWVRAGQWSAPQQILGVRFGLLLSSDDAVTEAESKTYAVLDSTASKRADGKLRRVIVFTAAIKGRTG